MLTIYMLSLLYFVVPATLALLGILGLKLGLITEHPRFSLTPRVRELSIEDRLSALIGVGVYFTGVLAGYKYFGGQVPALLAIPAFTLIAIPSILLSLKVLRATTIYRISPAFFNLVGSVVVASIVWLANLYTDAHIVQTIGVNGSEFPSAQKATTVILALGVAGLGLMFVTLAFYIISGLLLFKSSLDGEPASRARKRRFVMLGLPSYAKPKRKSMEHIYHIMFIGLAFTVIIIQKSATSFLQGEDVTRRINSLIVYASFHLKTSPCVNELPKGAKLALISDKRVAIAEADEKAAYQFRVVQCDGGLPDTRTAASEAPASH